MLFSSVEIFSCGKQCSEVFAFSSAFIISISLDFTLLCFSLIYFQISFLQFLRYYVSYHVYFELVVGYPADIICMLLVNAEEWICLAAVRMIFQMVR